MSLTAILSRNPRESKRLLLNQYLATQLRLAMEDTGLNGLGVAERSGVSPAMVSKILHAQTQPSVAVLLRVAAAFECRLEDFLPLPGEVS